MNDRLLRLGLVVLALASLYTGLWAVIDPHGWYLGYPGLGHHWTDAYGPYNHHLASDVGAGFLAIGVGTGYAAIRLTRPAARTALVAFLAFSIPHLIYHLTHQEHALTGGDRYASLAALAIAVALPIVLLAMTRRLGTRRGDRLRLMR